MDINKYLEEIHQRIHQALPKATDREKLKLDRFALLLKSPTGMETIQLLLELETSETLSLDIEEEERPTDEDNQETEEETTSQA